MIKIIANGAGVRRRTDPSTASGSNIDSTMVVGKTYQVEDFNLDWFALPLYIHKSVVTIIPDPAPPVDIPGAPSYKSQWDSDAQSRGADCGQTCVAMLAALKSILVAVDDLRFQSSSTGLTTGADLVRNFDSIGLKAAWRYWTDQDIKDYSEFSEFKNMICLVKYDGFKRESVQDDGYTGWHWVVYLGRTDTHVIVHDPDFWGNRRNEGAFKQYTHDEWNKAFKYSNVHGRVIVYLT